MTDISDIIKEAKPLYFKRKRNRRLGVVASLCCALVLMFNFVTGSKNISSPIYDVWSDEIYQAQNGSIIEDLGLPVDELGLLWVA